MLQKLFCALLASSLLMALGCAGTNDVAPSNTGQGGSMARFAVVGEHLYTVDEQSLRVFDVSDVNQPRFETMTQVGTDIETIFPRRETLFIGSRTGMHIWDVSTPNAPSRLSTYEHVFSCDPVVADERYAYVTLNADQVACGRGLNQLEVIDVEDLTRPQLVQLYPMTAPKGLGIADSLLFVCDEGVKVYDARDVRDLRLLHHFRIEAHDLIPHDGTLMVIGSDGLYQYRYENGELQLLSKLDIIPS
ncbi:MAG: hypothetical protein WBA12_09240 [Catalinimonas sp.]